VAEIGIDPSWEYGQFKSRNVTTSGGDPLDAMMDWECRDTGMENYSEYSSIRAERDAGNAPGVEMLQH